MMEPLKVVRLDQKANTGNRTVRTLLEDSIDDIENVEDFDPDKAIVLFLSSKDGQYRVTWSQANMKMSECITLCEIGKDMFKGEMGY